MSRKTAILVIIAVLAIILTACKSSDPTDSPVSPLDSPLGPSQEPELVEELAPIESVEIIIAESWPPQYFLLVQSGLPNGCAEFDRYELTRQNDVVKVAVINTVIMGQECTEEYRTVEHNIPLGSDFEPGATYTVQVNDVTETLVAQGGAVDLGPVSATLDSRFQLHPGQTALLEAQGLSVEFVEVVEDSRCPRGVLCTWAGQALIRIHVSSGGAQRALTLKLGPADSVTGAYDDSYLFEFQALDPYPQAPEQDAPPQPPYTATLVVSQLEAAPAELIQFFLIIPGDEGQSGPAVGCGDSAIAVWRNRAKTGSPPDDIRASLDELFSIQTQAYGQSGFLNALHDADLTVQNVTVRGDAALVDLSGSLSLVGTCADAQMEAQILHTIFQYTQVNSVLIHIDGANMRQMFDASGTVGADEPYRRTE